MAFIDVEVSEDELYDLMWASEEGVKQAVEARRVRPWVVGAAERTTLLTERRRELDARATCRDNFSFKDRNTIHWILIVSLDPCQRVP